jgi:hypothetical protein
MKPVEMRKSDEMKLVEMKLVEMRLGFYCCFQPWMDDAHVMIAWHT